MQTKRVKVVKISKNKECSQIIKEVSSAHPLPRHLKRVKSLDPNSLLLLHSLSTDQHCEEGDDLRQVPWNEPSTTEEWREWNKLWPCEFNRSSWEKLDKQHCDQTVQVLNSIFKLYESPLDSIIFKGEIYLSISDYKPESFFDPRDHGSFMLIKSKGITDSPFLLTDCIILLREEPCLACAMALLHSRVQTVIYKHTNPFNGALESIHKLMSVRGLNHYYKVYKILDQSNLS